jgi:hypothetical protein
MHRQKEGWVTNRLRPRRGRRFGAAREPFSERGRVKSGGLTNEIIIIISLAFFAGSIDLIVGMCIGTVPQTIENEY